MTVIKPLRRMGPKDQFDEVVVGCATGLIPERAPKTIRFSSSPLAKALKNAGSVHIYIDTADKDEMDELLIKGEDDQQITMISEIDGNTTNQPLVIKVLHRFFSDIGPENAVRWVRNMKMAKPDLSIQEATALIYTIINGRLGKEIIKNYGAGKKWEISLELHTELSSDPLISKRVGNYLHQMVPASFVKVAFTPHFPHSILVARDLETMGIPVNFTTTFSARQVVTAALLANVSRTNIFMGRLNQGLESELLGEQVDLVSQRALSMLRAGFGIKTLLIVASVRAWQTLAHVAGCDIFTVPGNVLKRFLTQTEISPEQIICKLDEDYSDRLGVSRTVLHKVGAQKISQLYTVEPEYIEFLDGLRSSEEYKKMTDGDQLYKRFDEAGFGDVFYSPTNDDWTELEKSKMPNLDAPLTRRLPLDTLYSLLAFADFAKVQDQMDRQIQKKISHLF